MKRTYDIEKVKEIARDKGCVALDNEYKNMSTAMNFRCSCGNHFSTTFGKFVHRNQNQCSECAMESRKSKLRLSYGEVKNTIEKAGCELVSTEYKNNTAPLDVICGCGSVFTVAYAHFARGKQHCDKCSSELSSERQRLDDSYVLSTIEKAGCEWIDGEYKRNTSLLTIRCECGNTFKTSFQRFTCKSKPKQQCNDCGDVVRYSKLRHSYNYVEQTVKDKGCVLISDEYINSETPIKIQCSCGEMFETTFNNFSGEKDKSTCDACSRSSSKGEVSIREFLLSNGVNFKEEAIVSGCSNIRDLRFDFVIYADNGDIIKAIEFDGQQHFYPVDFFGGERVFKEQVERDKIKNLFCEEEEIPLLRIPYTEYDNIDEILKNKLKAILCQG